MWCKTLLVLQCICCSFLVATVPNELIEGQNQFTSNLFKKVSSTSDNLVFSPYSIANALQLAYVGAEGQTKNEIGMLFSFSPSDSQTTFNNFKALNTFLSPKISSANLVAIDKNFNPERSYLDKVDSFGAKLFAIDTIHDVAASIASMNGWVKESTQGHIQDLLQPQDVNSLTKMVLLNAVYLKADWQSPFDLGQTKDDSFYTEKHETVPVLMMHKKEFLTLYQDKDVRVVWKDMKTKSDDEPAIETVILVPETDTGRKMLKSSFSSELLDHYKMNAARHLVELFFPKCSIKKRLELKDPLISLGMKQPFEQGADFSGISSSHKLLLQQVIHEAFMSFNETGLVATAATAAMVGLTSFLPDSTPPIIVRCDKPFFVVVVEKKTNLILFLGYIAKPENPV